MELGWCARSITYLSLLAMLRTMTAVHEPSFNIDSIHRGIGLVVNTGDADIASGLATCVLIHCLQVRLGLTPAPPRLLPR